jgi:hypothetical protein
VHPLDPYAIAAYEGYVIGAGGRSLISGEPLPSWPDLGPELREAWRAAADAVLMFRAMAHADEGTL